jgi:putative oxidoreductase
MIHGDMISTQINIALLVLRASVGVMIMMHGYAHIWKKGKVTIKNTAGWFGSMGMRPPVVQAWLASITELGSGALLVGGLFTPLAAAGLLGVMLVALLIAHRSNGFFIYNEGQGWEYVAIIMAVAVAVALLGPGQWSLDHALKIDFGTGGSLAALGAGVIGALMLLATCWRPPRN